MTSNNCFGTGFKSISIPANDQKRHTQYPESRKKGTDVEEQKSIFLHHRADHILTAYLKNGKMPHALLFTGTEDVGKYAAGL